jgi:hypothetical protein
VENPYIFKKRVLVTGAHSGFDGEFGAIEVSLSRPGIEKILACKKFIYASDFDSSEHIALRLRWDSNVLPLEGPEDAVKYSGDNKSSPEVDWEKFIVSEEYAGDTTYLRLFNGEVIPVVPLQKIEGGADDYEGEGIGYGELEEALRDADRKADEESDFIAGVIPQEKPNPDIVCCGCQ